MENLKDVVTEVQECFKNASPEDVVIKTVIESNTTTVAELSLKGKVKHPDRLIACRTFSDKEKDVFKALGISSCNVSVFCSQHLLDSFCDNDESRTAIYELYTIASTDEQVLIIY